MHITTTIRNFILLLALLLTATSVHSQGQLEGFGTITDISKSRGIIEVNGVKMKYDGSTQVLNHNKTVDTYTKITEVFKGTPVEWKARKGPRYPILIWVRPDLS